MPLIDVNINVKITVKIKCIILIKTCQVFFVSEIFIKLEIENLKFRDKIKLYIDTQYIYVYNHIYNHYY
jgi:hypothetical protein